MAGNEAAAVDIPSYCCCSLLACWMIDVTRLFSYHGNDHFSRQLCWLPKGKQNDDSSGNAVTTPGFWQCSGNTSKSDPFPLHSLPNQGLCEQTRRFTLSPSTQVRLAGAKQWWQLRFRWSQASAGAWVCRACGSGNQFCWAEVSKGECQKTTSIIDVPTQKCL